MDITDFCRARGHSFASLMHVVLATALSACAACASEEVPTQPRPEEDEVLEAFVGYCELETACSEPHELPVPPENYVEYCTDKKMDELAPTTTSCLRAILDYYECLLDLDAQDHMRGCYLFRYGMDPLECGDLDVAAGKVCDPLLYF